jgi:hypothetical protein
MHTDSSESFTYLASASAWECTATVLMPISRHARCIRRAISPRLAIRIFSNMFTGNYFLKMGVASCALGALAWDHSITNNGSPYSTGWPFSTRTAFITPLLSDSISLSSFIASMIQSVSPSLTVCPTSTNALEPGEELR